MIRLRQAVVLASLIVPLTLAGQELPGVTSERLLNAAKEPQNWLMYGGDYFSNRHSLLTEITPANVKNLQLAWMYQGRVAGAWEPTPLVVDGVMYLTQRPNDVVALDARTGRVFWIYQFPTDPRQTACCGSNNRGVAILGNTLFMGTLDGHLVAIDALNGHPLWKTEVAKLEDKFSITHAPLVVKHKVIVGVAGADMGVRDWLAAYDAKTGKEVWRFYTIPGPGEPGHETWEKCPPPTEIYCDPDAWKKGGGSIWATGSYDPELNLTYWGIGNPGPDYNAAQRPGDNLYTDSVVALDADTGKLKWHFQFTPHDHEDWDSTQVPVLADINFRGTQRKVMMWANRNGFFYVLDRQTGEFLHGHPFVKVNWATLDPKGRPIETPVPLGQPTFPGNGGGTNWFSPAYSPRTGLFYVQAWEDYATIRLTRDPIKELGSGFGEAGERSRYYMGGTARSYASVPGAPAAPQIGRGPINTWTSEAGHGRVLAIDPKTGEHKWAFEMTDFSAAGITTTASNLVLTGTRDGYFLALDARSGELLWKAALGSQVFAGPMTYQANGHQYVSVISGLTLVTFALPDAPRP